MAVIDLDGRNCEPIDFTVGDNHIFRGVEPTNLPNNIPHLHLVLDEHAAITFQFLLNLRDDCRPVFDLVIHSLLHDETVPESFQPWSDPSAL